MKQIVLFVSALALASAGLAEDVAEPRSGVTFAARSDDMSLLGVGLRTKTFLKVKVYAIGFYVADAALAGPLAVHRGKLGTPAFYADLLEGDFEKRIVMKFVRDVSTNQIRDAFRESLKGAEATKVDLFTGYFSDTRSGEQYTLTWKPGGVLETKVAGLAKSPITDKAFASAVLGIWLGDKPVQADVKKDLVSRAAELIK